MQQIIAQALEQGIRLAAVPIGRLADLRADLERLQAEYVLNGFQQWIVRERYVLDPPDAGFAVRSLVIALCPMELTRASFQHGGVTAYDLLGDSAPRPMSERLAPLFAARGYRLAYVHWLPQKRLAVRAGLARYGRNNITYAPGLGSLIHLASYVSDLPVEAHPWGPVESLDACAGCEACQRACPTGAMQPGRFLLDNERCLTNLNEQGGATFPDWVPPSAHHRVLGCLRCQQVCPLNAARLADVSQAVTLDEHETALLLAGGALERLPEALRDKLVRYGLDTCYAGLARNLRLLLERAR